jgi:hypothetical protein
MHFHSKQSIKILHRFTSTPSKQYKSYTDSFPLQASNEDHADIHFPTQSTVIIHWLCYCTAVSMLSFLPVIVCGLLELKRICVGFLLIVWHGNESVREFYYLLGVDANLCRIFISSKNPAQLLSTPNKQYKSCTDSFSLQASNATSHVVVVYDLI